MKIERICGYFEADRDLLDTRKADSGLSDEATADC